MLESYLAPFLLRTLSTYTTNLSASDLRLSLSGGLVSLREVSLNAENISSLLPIGGVRLVSGSISFLSLMIPWSSLLSDSIKIVIEGLEMRIAVDEHVYFREDPLKKPTAVPVEVTTASSEFDLLDDVLFDFSMLQDSILHNVNFELRNVRIIVVDGKTAIDTFCLSLDCCSSSPSDALGRTKSHSPEGPLKHMRRRSQVQGLKVAYLLTSTFLVDDTNADVRSDVFLKPLPHEPFFTADVRTKHLNIRLTDESVELGMRIAKSFLLLAANVKPLHLQGSVDDVRDEVEVVRETEQLSLVVATETAASTQKGWLSSMWSFITAEEEATSNSKSFAASSTASASSSSEPPRSVVKPAKVGVSAESSIEVLVALHVYCASFFLSFNDVPIVQSADIQVHTLPNGFVGVDAGTVGLWNGAFEVDGLSVSFYDRDLKVSCRSSAISVDNFLSGCNLWVSSILRLCPLILDGLGTVLHSEDGTDSRTAPRDVSVTDVLVTVDIPKFSVSWSAEDCELEVRHAKLDNSRVLSVSAIDFDFSGGHCGFSMSSVLVNLERLSVGVRSFIGRWGLNVVLEASELAFSAESAAVAAFKLSLLDQVSVSIQDFHCDRTSFVVPQFSFFPSDFISFADSVGWIVNLSLFGMDPWTVDDVAIFLTKMSETVSKRYLAPFSAVFDLIGAVSGLFPAADPPAELHDATPIRLPLPSSFAFRLPHCVSFVEIPLRLFPWDPAITRLDIMSLSFSMSSQVFETSLSLHSGSETLLLAEDLSFSVSQPSRSVSIRNLQVALPYAKLLVCFWHWQSPGNASSETVASQEPVAASSLSVEISSFTIAVLPLVLLEGKEFVFEQKGKEAHLSFRARMLFGRSHVLVDPVTLSILIVPGGKYDVWHMSFSPSFIFHVPSADTLSLVCTESSSALEEHLLACRIFDNFRVTLPPVAAGESRLSIPKFVVEFGSFSLFITDFHLHDDVDFELKVVSECIGLRTLTSTIVSLPLGTVKWIRNSSISRIVEDPDADLAELRISGTDVVTLSRLCNEYASRSFSLVPMSAHSVESGSTDDEEKTAESKNHGLVETPSDSSSSKILLDVPFPLLLVSVAFTEEIVQTIRFSQGKLFNAPDEHEAMAVCFSTVKVDGRFVSGEASDVSILLVHGRSTSFILKSLHLKIFAFHLPSFIRDLEILVSEINTSLLLPSSPSPAPDIQSPSNSQSIKFKSEKVLVSVLFSSDLTCDLLLRPLALSYFGDSLSVNSEVSCSLPDVETGEAIPNCMEVDISLMFLLGRRMEAALPRVNLRVSAAVLRTLRCLSKFSPHHSEVGSLFVQNQSRFPFSISCGPHRISEFPAVLHVPILASFNLFLDSFSSSSFSFSQLNIRQEVSVGPYLVILELMECTDRPCIANLCIRPSFRIAIPSFLTSFALCGVTVDKALVSYDDREVDVLLHSTAPSLLSRISVRENNCGATFEPNCLFSDVYGSDFHLCKKVVDTSVVLSNAKQQFFLLTPLADSVGRFSHLSPCFIVDSDESATVENASVLAFSDPFADVSVVVGGLPVRIPPDCLENCRQDSDNTIQSLVARSLQVDELVITLSRHPMLFSTIVVHVAPFVRTRTASCLQGLGCVLDGSVLKVTDWSFKVSVGGIFLKDAFGEPVILSWSFHGTVDVFHGDLPLAVSVGFKSGVCVELRPRFLLRNMTAHPLRLMEAHEENNVGFVSPDDTCPIFCKLDDLLCVSIGDSGQWSLPFSIRSPQEVFCPPFSLICVPDHSTGILTMSLSPNPCPLVFWNTSPFHITVQSAQVPALFSACNIGPEGKMFLTSPNKRLVVRLIVLDDAGAVTDVLQRLSVPSIVGGKDGCWTCQLPDSGVFVCISISNSVLLVRFSMSSEPIEDGFLHSLVVRVPVDPGIAVSVKISTISVLLFSPASFDAVASVCIRETQVEAQLIKSLKFSCSGVDVFDGSSSAEHGHVLAVPGFMLHVPSLSVSKNQVLDFVYLSEGAVLSVCGDVGLRIEDSWATQMQVLFSTFVQKHGKDVLQYFPEEVVLPGCPPPSARPVVIALSAPVEISSVTLDGSVSVGRIHAPHLRISTSAFLFPSNVSGGLAASSSTTSTGLSFDLSTFQSYYASDLGRTTEFASASQQSQSAHVGRRVLFLGSAEVLQEAIVEHYLTDSVLSSPLIIGSLSVLGNPTGIIRGLKNTVVGVVRETRETGILAIPKGIGGAVKDVGKWGINVVKGFSKAVGIKRHGSGHPASAGPSSPNALSKSAAIPQLKRM
eukprot:ANDGO_08318.mRNA.1 hypothetical protein ACA1_324050